MTFLGLLFIFIFLGAHVFFNREVLKYHAKGSLKLYQAALLLIFGLAVIVAQYNIIIHLFFRGY